MFQIDPTIQNHVPLTQIPGQAVHAGPVNSIPYTIPAVPYTAQLWNQTVPQTWNPTIPQSTIPQTIPQAIPQTMIPQTIGQLPLGYQGVVPQLPIQAAIQPIHPLQGLFVNRVPQMVAQIPGMTTLQPQVPFYNQHLGYTAIQHGPWGANSFIPRY